MGIVRTILLTAAFWLLFALLRKLVRSRRGDQSGTTRGPAEKMVPCAHCGTYLPISDAVHAQGKDFCSHDHARAVSKTDA